MKVLVTGGSGFVGRHLISALVDQKFEVRVLDLAKSDGVEMIVASVNDVDAVETAMSGVDVVYHLAGDAQLWARDRARFDRINHHGTKTVAEAALKARVRRFVHCSSLTTLVGRRMPIGDSAVDETVVLSASDMIGPYPRSKLLAEHAVHDAVTRGLDAVVVIPTEPLGPGDLSLTPPTRMILDLLNRRIPATIDCLLNFVSVRSLAQGLIAAAERGRLGNRYILGGEDVPMTRLLAELERQTGRKMPAAKLPYAVALLAGVADTGVAARLTGKAPMAPLTGVRLAGRRVSFSSAKAHRELNWKSEGFSSSLADALVWYREQGLLLD